jgi:VWFA-related protein
MRYFSRASLAVLIAFLFGVPGGGVFAARGTSQSPAQPPAQQPAQPPAGQQPPAQPQGQRQQPPVIRSGINFVSVDVIVSDKKTGEVVMDLTKDDFDVREDKKPQTVQTFETIKIDPFAEATAVPPRPINNEDDEEREAKKPDVRLFILLLDDYHVRRGNDMAVKKPLIDFVQNQLGPQDMVAVMYPLTPVTALSFTRDHDALISAINNFQGRRGIYEPKNEFEERYAYASAQTVEGIRNDVTMGALKGAAVKLGGMRDGRKSIIFISEGFTSALPAQLQDPVAALPGYGNPARQSPGTDVTSPRQDSVDFFNSVDLQDRMREVFDTANRNNTSIYAVDPRGLAVFDYDIKDGVSTTSDRKSLNESIDALRVLADNTDGRAIVNRNDLASGMKQIMRDSSGYYLLGYTSSAAPTDGKFHSIDVHVKRPGVEVRARKGYWAYTAEDAAKATAPPAAGPPPAVSKALSGLAAPAAGHAAKFWIGTDRGDANGARVTFAWEPITQAAGSRSDVTAAKVMLTATAPDGRPLFRGEIPGGAASMASAPAASSPPSSSAASNAPARTTTGGAMASFNAPPGPVQLRIMVMGPRGQVIDSSEQDITVPDYTRTQVSIGTPRVYRARSAYEMSQVRNNPNAPPTVDREFSRTERLLVRFDAYAGDSSAPAVSAKLLNRAGQSMADVPVQTAAGKPCQIDLPLASLAAGQYVLELDAKTPAGTAQEMIAFRVGS